MKVQAEIIEARIDGRDLLYRQDKIALTRGDPNRRVSDRYTEREPRVTQKRRVIHSTSWRHEPGHYVLTYLVYSDDATLAGAKRVPLARLPKRGGRGLAVVAHALRHPRSSRPRTRGRTGARWTARRCLL